MNFKGAQRRPRFFARSKPLCPFRGKGKKRIMADINGAFEVDGLVKQREELERLMMSNPQMEKRVQKVIRKVLMAARKDIMGGITFKHGDPRQARKAVKTAVYRQILGGSVSILNKRGVKFDNYEPVRALQPGQRGGNRRVRSDRSNKLMHYAGESRAFVLRFLNAGTQGRAIRFTIDPHRSKVNKGSQGGNLRKYGKTVNTGASGNIAPRNFFGNSSHRAIQKAVDQLSQLIDDMIKQEFRK